MLNKIYILGSIILLAITSCTNTVKTEEQERIDTITSTPSTDKVATEDTVLEKPYHPEHNAREEINKLVKQAQAENKNIILQVGGNWCIWCLRFDKFRKNTPEVVAVLEPNFLYYHLNTSPENKNEEILQSLGDPGQHGYPVFVILDQNGKRLHTQESGSLEKDKSYNIPKVVSFFEQWKPNN